MTWSATDKLRCVERELSYRYRVFARKVEKGEMTQHQASREISIMEQIASEYREQAEKEQLL